MPKATLINDTGQKVVVDSGSNEAQGYFSSGYKLMGADGKAVPTPERYPAPVPPAVAPPLGADSAGYPLRYTSDTDQKTADYYTNLPKTFTPEDEATIRESTRKQMQAQIDAINNASNLLLGDARVQGGNRLGQARALASRSGILDSEMGAAQKKGVEDVNLGIEKSIEADRALKLSSVFGKIDERADALVKAKKEEALTNAKTYIDYLNSQQSSAREDVKALAQGGVSLDRLASDDRKKILEQTGFSDFMLEAYYNANKPAASKIDYQYKIQGDKLVAYGVDPKTGKLKYVEQDLPAEFQNKEYSGFTVTPDGTPLFYDTQTGKATIAPGFKEGQFIKPTAGGGSTVQPDETTTSGIAADIQSIRGDDGYLDTAKYFQLREHLATTNPKALAWFDKTYSPKIVLNPNDPTNPYAPKTATKQKVLKLPGG